MKMQLRRVPWVWVAASALAITLLAVESTLGATVYGAPIPFSLGLSALQAASVLLVLRLPRLGTAAAAVGVVTMMIVGQATGEAPWPISVSAIIAMVVVLAVATARGCWAYAGLAGLAVSVVATVTATRNGAELPAGPIIANITVFLSLAAAAIGIGTLLRTALRARGELVAAREVSELALARREIVEERTRIAREMHDVVAHGMSVIQVQAASARYRHSDIAPEVADEFDELAATARTALGEMRALLGVLRADEDAEQAPQPGLAELPELVLRSRAILADELPESVRRQIDPVSALTVYRVVQESLSNVVRHAPGSEATVELHYEPPRGATLAAGQLRVRVRNSRPTDGPTPAADTSGHGIRGMQERVAAIGGALSTAPTSDGGFAVVALIPLSLEASSA